MGFWVDPILAGCSDQAPCVARLPVATLEILSSPADTSLKPAGKGRGVLERLSGSVLRVLPLPAPILHHVQLPSASPPCMQAGPAGPSPQQC